MGRRRKGVPKDLPLGITRLTINQYTLLFHILVHTYMGPGDGKLRVWREYPVTWSPKAVLGKSPTKNEAAGLSRRLSVLVKHGLVEKRGRMVNVTTYGKTMLRSYALEHEGHSENGDLLRLARMIVDRHETASNIEAIQKTMNIARIQGRSNLLTAGRGTLPDLFDGEIKKLNKLSREIDNELDTHTSGK